MKTGNLSWRVNLQIRSPQVRVIGKDGKQVGVIKIQDALDLAQKEGLDLVEVAPYENPPVVRVIELGKFKYLQEKKLKKDKKSSKASELKEVRLSPFIAEHDFEVRLGKISEFLESKHKVRVVVVFKGRQMDSKKFGYDLLEKVKRTLGDKIAVDMEPKFIGRHLAIVVSPLIKARRRESETVKQD